MAMAIASIFMMPFMLFGGFFANRGSYLNWIGWLEYKSLFKYGFEAFCWNKYSDTGFRPELTSLLGFELGLWKCFLISLGLFTFYRLLAVYFLMEKLKKTRMKISLLF